MSSAVRMLTVLLLLDVGAAQVLATGKPARAEADIKYAVIGTAVGIAISAGFLALKFCMIRKHMFDNDSSDLRSTNVGFNETIALKKRTSRLNLSFSERYQGCNPINQNSFPGTLVASEFVSTNITVLKIGQKNLGILLISLKINF
ncbi:transmembrane protein 273 isoform X1 [Bos indicus]|uniref:Transmembrane protein 273 n=2 Tax=Bos TaxID=9903 RepID=A0A4W2DKC9_BOBOX